MSKYNIDNGETATVDEISVTKKNIPEAASKSVSWFPVNIFLCATVYFSSVEAARSTVLHVLCLSVGTQQGWAVNWGHRPTPSANPAVSLPSAAASISFLCLGRNWLSRHEALPTRALLGRNKNWITVSGRRQIGLAIRPIIYIQTAAEACRSPTLRRIYLFITFDSCRLRCVQNVVFSVVLIVRT